MPRPGASSSTDLGGTTGRLLAALAVAVAVAAGMAFSLLPAGAESPTVVAEEVAVDGAYVAPERSDVNEAQLVEQANQARALGLRLGVVVPNDPQPDAEAFARRILEAGDLDVALVFPPEGGLEAEVVEEFESDSFRALAAARSKSDPALATQVFAQELLTEPDRSVPSIVSRTIFVVLLLAALLAAVVILEQAVRRGTAAAGPLWTPPSWWPRRG